MHFLQQILFFLVFSSADFYHGLRSDSSLHNAPVILISCRSGLQTVMYIQQWFLPVAFTHREISTSAEPFLLAALACGWYLLVSVSGSHPSWFLSVLNHWSVKLSFQYLTTLQTVVFMAFVPNSLCLLFISVNFVYKTFPGVCTTNGLNSILQQSERPGLLMQPLCVRYFRNELSGRASHPAWLKKAPSQSTGGGGRQSPMTAALTATFKPRHSS